MGVGQDLEQPAPARLARRKRPHHPVEHVEVVEQRDHFVVPLHQFSADQPVDRCAVPCS